MPFLIEEMSIAARNNFSHVPTHRNWDIDILLSMPEVNFGGDVL
jgi:hypothetical protein